MFNLTYLEIFAIFQWLLLLQESVTRLQLFTRISYLSPPVQCHSPVQPHVHFRIHTAMHLQCSAEKNVAKCTILSKNVHFWACCSGYSLFCVKSCNSRTFFKATLFRMVLFGQLTSLICGSVWWRNFEEYISAGCLKSESIVEEHKLDPRRTTKQK